MASGYQPVVVDRFGGLLADYRANIPGRGTLASSNFILGDGGYSVRARTGFSVHTSGGGAAAAYSQLYAHSDTILLARRTTTLAAINTSGAEATTTTVSSSNFVHATRFGTPSASYSYIADGSTTLIRYDGSVFASGASSATVDGVGSKAMPIGKFLTVTGSSNRLVVAGTTATGGPNGAASSGSHAWFSNPGSGETWTSTNYVQLDPGDGESITGCVTWRDQVFVFKRTKMYIFYSETTDASGNPIFNYRSVQLGGRVFVPASTSGNPSIAAGREAVYFVGPRGLYVTTGDLAAVLSDEAIRGNPSEPSPPSAGVHASSLGLGGVHYHEGRVYAPNGSGGADVYDEALDAWAPWVVPVTGFQTWNNGTTDTGSTLMASATNANHVVKFGTSNTTDNGTAIGTRIYQLTYWDLGLPGEKVVREVEVWGAGTFTVTLNVDNTTNGTPVSMSLGAEDNVASVRKFAPATAKGFYFSVQISGTAYWRIDRIILHLGSIRNIGAKSS